MHGRTAPSVTGPPGILPCWRRFPSGTGTRRQPERLGPATAEEGAVHRTEDLVPGARLEEHLVTVLPNQLEALVLGEAGAHDDRQVGPHLAHPAIEVEAGTVAEHHVEQHRVELQVIAGERLD